MFPRALRMWKHHAFSRRSAEVLRSAAGKAPPQTSPRRVPSSAQPGRRVPAGVANGCRAAARRPVAAQSAAGGGTRGRPQATAAVMCGQGLLLLGLLIVLLQAVQAGTCAFTVRWQNLTAHLHPSVHVGKLKGYFPQKRTVSSEGRGFSPWWGSWRLGDRADSRMSVIGSKERR